MHFLASGCLSSAVWADGRMQWFKAVVGLFTARPSAARPRHQTGSRIERLKVLPPSGGRAERRGLCKRVRGLKVMPPTGGRAERRGAKSAFFFTSDGLSYAVWADGRVLWFKAVVRLFFTARPSAGRPRHGQYRELNGLKCCPPRGGERSGGGGERIFLSATDGVFGKNNSIRNFEKF